VRGRLVCATVEDRALERTDQLLAGGIVLHVQIVLVPGVNDGSVLERTLAWLAARPLIESVGVVPVGFTAHQRRHEEGFATSDAAGRVLDALEPWRERMLAERGRRWVHAADELYVAAGSDLPPSQDYDGFPQYENGIGLARAFRDAWIPGSAVAIAAPVAPAGPVTLLTGELFAPTLRELLATAPLPRTECRVLAVPNRFFGGNVSVAGLLTASDIASTVATDGGRGIYLVPDVVLNSDGVTLDDVSEGALAALCGADLRVVSSDAAEFLAASDGLSGEHTG
jgi:NifB/MoaA-like Fe-S oxidoreductase